MKNGLVISSGKSHRRFSIPVKTKANAAEMKARRALASDLLAQGVQLSEIGVAIAKKFEMPEKQAKKWVYNNHQQLKAMRKAHKAEKVVRVIATSAADQPGPADAVNDAPPAVRPMQVGRSVIGAVQIPLVTAQRAVLMMKRETFKTDVLAETIESLEDAIAKAIGL